MANLVLERVWEIGTLRVLTERSIQVNEENGQDAYIVTTPPLGAYLLFMHNLTFVVYTVTVSQ